MLIYNTLTITNLTKLEMLKSILSFVVYYSVLYSPSVLLVSSVSSYIVCHIKELCGIPSFTSSRRCKCMNSTQGL